ncbi:MAG: flavin reductase family protein [Bacteroidia bacterium]|nr:flavin reductase family protein [Bacteroidia bacterium]
MTRIDKATIEGYEKLYRTNFVNSLWGFKSVSLIGTQDQNSHTNLAIFSQIVHLGANPALVGLIVRPPETERHSYENMKSTGWFTLNHIHPGIVDKAHQTAARYGRDVSEFDAVGLTPFYSEKVKAPYVKESRLQIGCRFDGEQIIPQNNTLLVIGRVEEVWLNEDAIMNDGYIDIEELETVTSSNLDCYHSTTRLARYAYAKPDKPLLRIG